MRAAGQLKLGYYPADPELGQRFSAMMRWPEDLPTGQAGKPAHVLDPCCGQGEAVRAFAPTSAVLYGVELAKNRAEAAQTVLPNVLYGAFEQCRISSECFSACWLNPPYDDELGGGKRTELEFLQRVTPLLVSGGILVFWLPSRILVSSRIWGYVSSYYDRIAVYHHPPTERSGYRDIPVAILVGAKRLQPVSASGHVDVPWSSQLDADTQWRVPPGRKPRMWERCGLTDEEIHQVAEASPLWSTLAGEGPLAIGRPLLPLKLGHIPMVLASGRLNGLIGDHVARATIEKRWQTIEVRTSEDSEGRVQEHHVQRERVRLTIRCLAKHEGRVAIHDFA